MAPVLACAVVIGLIFSQIQAASTNESSAKTAQPSDSNGNEAIATFAGGCFWCIESGFEKLPGVTEAVSGFTGGEAKNPTYKQVSRGGTGHTEAVQVHYDPSIISYEDLLEGFWRQFDPTDGKGSFVDRGSQYRSGIYYSDERQHAIARKALAALESSGRYDKPLAVELEPLDIFYPAEDYHQDYYQKNPVRYKYYRFGSGRDQYLEKFWGDELAFSIKGPAQSQNQSDDGEQIDNMAKGKRNTQPISSMKNDTSNIYTKPSDELLRKQLNKLQYQVTQKEGTEQPFSNEYHDNKKAGIYVDIVSGEPLFSSKDKYDSGTGWPSFSQPINIERIVTKKDFKLILPRTEVRSVAANSHLGHVFNDGPAPTGLRYCLNSAALRFVPKEDMVSEGYADLLAMLEE